MITAIAAAWSRVVQVHHLSGPHDCTWCQSDQEAQGGDSDQALYYASCHGSFACHSALFESLNKPGISEVRMADLACTPGWHRGGLVCTVFLHKEFQTKLHINTLASGSLSASEMT